MMNDKDEERAMEREAGRATVRTYWVPPVLTYPQPADLKMTDLGLSYGTYSTFRSKGWTNEQMVARGYAERASVAPSVYPAADKVEAFRTVIERWCAEARRMGFVITIEQAPCEPLAMGNHRDVVTVREVRK
jgi:hypothetical protein